MIENREINTIGELKEFLKDYPDDFDLYLYDKFGNKEHIRYVETSSYGREMCLCDSDKYFY